MSGVLLALFGGGVSTPSGSYTVSVGFFQQGSNFFYFGFGGSPVAYGSVTPTTFSNSGTSILTLGSTLQNGQYYTANLLNFSITGTSPQSLFTTLVVSGQVYTSSSASYSVGGSGSTTNWTWNITGTDPFAANVGSNLVVSFT